MNFDEKVRFVQAVSPLDEDTQASVQPTADNERFHQAVLNRPIENLRQRTEILRKAVEDLKYRSDYAALLPQSFGRFRLNAVSSTTWTIETDEDEDSPTLVITPALTPGSVSGGRVNSTINLSGARVIDPETPNKYYLGVLGTNDIWLFASTTHTGQRAYADGTTMADLDVCSVGANNISVSLRPDDDLSAHEVVVDTVTGNPRRHISIRYGDGTTIGELRDFINNDRLGSAPVGGPSQDGQTWGIANMIRAATTATTSNILTGADLIDTGLTPIQMQGAADAEFFSVRAFDTFFGTSANQLREGESLALAFTSGSVEEAPGYGGRRQSILDRPDDRIGGTATFTLSDSLLFNTGRFPERIPGSIPIGKCYANQFVFIDGTVLSCPPWTGSTTHGPWTRLGQNAPFLIELSAATGALLVGTDETGVWNTTTSLTAEPDALRSIPAGTLQSSLNAIVSQLGKIDSVSSPHDSGARRIGVEELPVSSTTPNAGLEPDEGSLYEVLSQFLNNSLYGLNARVSQWGHYMRGTGGLKKIYGTEAPDGGGDMAVATLPTLGDIASATTATDDNRIVMSMQPVEWHTTPGTTELLLEEPVSGVVTTNYTLQLSSASIATRITTFKDKLPIGTTTGVGLLVGNIIVTLSGFVPGAGKTDTNGPYYLRLVNTGTHSFTLCRMDGLGFTDPTGAIPALHPDFSTGDFTNAKVTVHNTLLIGSDIHGQKIRAFHAGPSPFMNVAMQKTTTPIIESCVASSSVSPPPRALQLTPAKLEFKTSTLTSALTSTNLQFLDGASVLRHSDNILQTLDKQANDGNETGIMVDATVNGSHHHDVTYSARLHGHSIGSNNALMTAYSAADGTSLGTGPTVTAISAVGGSHPGIVLYRVPTVANVFSTDDVDVFSIFEIDFTLQSDIPGSDGVVDLATAYSIGAWQRHTTVTWTGGASITLYGLAFSDSDGESSFAPSGAGIFQRRRRTFCLKAPNLGAGDPTEYVSYVGFGITGAGADLNETTSTVSVRHIMTYTQPTV